jgi:2-keto-3-deoxy-L-rhamnonate aldolase RhmA
MKNALKSKLRSGERVVGTMIFLGDPAIVEIAALAGFDFVIIDMEHSPRDARAVEEMIRAAEVRRITPLVRVPELDEKQILVALESGAQGIVVPQVESSEQAQGAVAAIRYPPAGRRGACRSTRAALYGLRAAEFGAHADEADEELLVVGIIETQAGVERLAAILDAGVEVAFIGRSDLSTSLGLRGDHEHPDVTSLTARAVAEIRSHEPKRWAGIVPYRLADGSLETHGCPFVVQGTDSGALMTAFQASLAELRADVPARA